MSAYLQRLARPAARQATTTGAGRAGVQELHQVVEVEVGVATPHGERSPPAQAPASDPRSAVRAYVTGWLAGPPTVHTSASTAGVQADRQHTGATNTFVMTEVAAAPDSGQPSHATRDAPVAKVTDRSQAMTAPVTDPIPLPPAIGWDSLALRSSPASDGATTGSPALAPAPTGLAAIAPPAQAGPLTRPHPGRAVPRSNRARGTPGAGPVEVHIGSIALTVKVPPHPPVPAATTPAPAPAGAATTGTGRTPADTLRFSPARHHLRWN